ncbi:SEC-C domain-containing protein [Mucilaginibacter sp. HMF5004]|uniref:YecA family protein n=1 Tax=Mucilaginibacter rivuli TaxID=2857527 RepID=UPI001C5ECDFE|nr:SEC-C domain-containing protein [Mucilaginibacter rivuli]MBW4888903.1 SEC-C domain-containing protein [Mucilaginibacter rivuli]
MQKVHRNDPCPCGSGKKFKKCCINEAAAEEPFSFGDFKASMPEIPEVDLTFLKAFDPLEVLKLLGLLQVLPQNHGKNIRLERLISRVINDIGATKVNYDRSTDYRSLLKALRAKCTKHPFEDPAEEFLTDNIVFLNGNNIVYPGIFSDAAAIAQRNLYTLTLRRRLPIRFIKETSEAVIFLLHIHDHIARQLGQSYRIFEDIKEDELYVPSAVLAVEQKEYFEFSDSELVAMCGSNMLDPGVIDQFIFSVQGQKIDLSNPDENPLFRKPFIKIGDRFIVPLPTAELACINEFVLEQAERHGVLNQYISYFAEDCQEDVDEIFKRMGWTSLQFESPESEQRSPYVIVKESMFQFDTDKLALVIMINEVPTLKGKQVQDFEAMTKIYTERIERVVARIKEKDPARKLLLVEIINKSNILDNFYMALPPQKDIDLEIAFSLTALELLTSKWDFDPLTIWQYATHLKETADIITFMHHNTHLSKFKWFKDNNDSFFQNDERPMEMVFFDFEIEGGVKRDAKSKSDRIGIPFFNDGQTGYVQCHRKEKYYPVYISNETKFGFFRSCLLKYSCPIWVQSNTLSDYNAEMYMSALLFWLHECYDDLASFIGQFGEVPIMITLLFHKEFREPEKWDIGESAEPFSLKYEIKDVMRAAEINIPIEVVSRFVGSGNQGERYFVTEVIDILGALIEKLGTGSRMTEDAKGTALERHMARSMKKMIIITDSDNTPILSDVDLPRARKVPDFDVSYLLQSQVKWLAYKTPISNNITEKPAKVKLLNDLVAVHFQKLIEMIAAYPAIPLLHFLMKQHESIVQNREHRKISYPVQEACYSKFYNVFEKFNETESALVTVGLALRSLIEFVACEMPSGTAMVNHSDTDRMLAHMSELLNCGSISDSVNYDIADPEIGILKSGRIKIGAYINSDFARDIYQEDFDHFIAEFQHNFTRAKRKAIAVKVAEPYFDRVDDIFTKEWGITVWNIAGACKHICTQLLVAGSSVELVPESDIYKMLGSGLSDGEISSLLSLLTFVQRNGVMNVPQKQRHEIYPWRYNRRNSYLSRPLIKLVINGQNFYLLSARHIYMAGHNMVSRFLDGTLKVDEKNFGINNLLAGRNHIKGTNFRNSVCSWLKANTGLQVISHEVKIKPKGFFVADSDKGDIDVLCIDHDKKIIYAIECKNTTQAKIAYDIYSEMNNYIGKDGKEGMIIKHIKRDQWLKSNIEQVRQKLNIGDPYQIRSFVLTNHIMPTKYVKDLKIPAFSFSDLERGKVFSVAQKPKN